MYVKQFRAIFVLPRNCLASALDYIVMQMRKIDREIQIQKQIQIAYIQIVRYPRVYIEFAENTLFTTLFEQVSRPKNNFKTPKNPTFVLLQSM